MNINASSTGEEIGSIALAIHQLVNCLPLTMRTLENKGVRIEDNKVLDSDYTGPVLEEALKEGKIIKKIPETGDYQGVPVVVVPVIEEGKVIVAIGVVDITKGIYSDIMEITKRPEEPNESWGDVQ
jgi:hypothetical protein